MQRKEKSKASGMRSTSRSSPLSQLSKPYDEVMQLEYLGYLMDALSTRAKIDNATLGRGTLLQGDSGREVPVTLSVSETIFDATGKIDEKLSSELKIKLNDPNRVTPVVLEKHYALPPLQLSQKERLILDAAIFEAGFRFDQAHHAETSSAREILDDNEMRVAFGKLKEPIRAIVSSLPTSGGLLKDQSGCELSNEFAQSLHTLHSTLRVAIELHRFNDFCEAFKQSLPEEYQVYFDVKSDASGSDKKLKPHDPVLLHIYLLVNTIRQTRDKIKNDELNCKDSMESFVLPQMAELRAASNVKQENGRWPLTSKQPNSLVRAIDDFVEKYETIADTVFESRLPSLKSSK